MEQKPNSMTISSAFLICFLGIFHYSQGQMIDQNEIAQFRWKNRMFLIVSSDVEFVNQQLSTLDLNADYEGWKERKMKWMILLPDRYQIENENWKLKTSLYHAYQDPKQVGYCILIGLDGSIKQKSKGLVTTQALFDWVDNMPMRQSELREKY